MHHTFRRRNGHTSSTSSTCVVHRQGTKGSRDVEKGKNYTFITLLRLETKRVRSHRPLFSTSKSHGIPWRLLDIAVPGTPHDPEISSATWHTHRLRRIPALLRWTWARPIFTTYHRGIGHDSNRCGTSSSYMYINWSSSSAGQWDIIQRRVFQLNRRYNEQKRAFTEGRN